MILKIRTNGFIGFNSLRTYFREAFIFLYSRHHPVDKTSTGMSFIMLEELRLASRFPRFQGMFCVEFFLFSFPICARTDAHQAVLACEANRALREEFVRIYAEPVLQNFLDEQ